MSQWVLTRTGDVMPIQTLRHLTPAEKNNPSIQERMREFDEAIKKRLGDSATGPKQSDQKDNELDDDPVIYEEYQDLYEDEIPPTPEMDNIAHNPSLLIDAEVVLPH